MLRHTINWKEIYDKEHKYWNSLTFDSWRELTDKFGNKPITVWNLIGHVLFNHNNYNMKANSINKVLADQKELNLPLLDFATEISKDNNLVEILKIFQECSVNHTTYTFACLRLVMGFMNKKISEWIDVTIGEYNHGILRGVVLPQWLKVIVDRQKIMAINAGLTEENPLLFVMRWNDYNKNFLVMRGLLPTDHEISNFAYILFRLKNGKITHYANSYKRFCGMKQESILQNTTLVRHLPMLKRKRKNRTWSLEKLNHLVGVLTYTNGRKEIYDFGYLIAEQEPGVYMIHGTKGIYFAPYYLITQPVVRKDRTKDNELKNNLSSLGYADQEYYNNINTHRQLIDHTIKPKRINNVIE